MDDSQSILDEFLIESSENLARLDLEFVELEQRPEDDELLSSIFRTIHTIKGTCGFFEFQTLEAIAHRAENLLSQLRDHEKRLTPALTTLLLETVDVIKQILKQIEETGSEGSEAYDTLRAQLQAACDSDPEAAPPPDSVSGSPSQVKPTDAESAAAAPDDEKLDEAASPEPPAATVEAAPLDDEQSAVSAAQTAELAAAPAPPPPNAAATVNKDASPATSGSADSKSRGASGQRSVADSTIRVDVTLLDNLMNLAGELVLSRNQMLQHSITYNDASLTATSQRLNLITTELQAEVMKTRMQPIGVIWNKFPRVVRDLGQASGKQITLHMEGEETELDKTIIEAIKDPLTHIVRNSCDHGVEAPAERAAKGKPAQGTISLRAYHEGGQVNIEILDDGAGIDTQVIKDKALQKGVITADQAQKMGEREILNLVFAAGFSTAAKITKVSGRGVGMDVVKTHIEKIGGSIDLQSQVGRGTTIRIKIPLTLAIIPALIVSVGNEKFAIPQVNLLELVRLEESVSQTAIEWIHGSPVYRLRGKLLPLIYLSKLLAAEESEELSGDKADDSLNIVVLQADDRMFGLVVDEVHNTQEIVVKPLSELLKGTNCYAGATIMGDGNVALILDVVGLVQLGCVVNEARNQAVAASDQKTATGVERQSLLLFRSGTSRLAVPLALVGRLEEFPRSEIEHAGDRDVVQYREQILALIPLARQLGLSPAAESADDDPVQVIVFSEGTRRVGLVVDEILDIVDESVTIRNQHKQPGILGSAVVGGLVTEFIDLHYLIENLEQKWFSGAAGRGETSGRILIADGSHFSRNLVRNYLEMAGYQVLEAANSQEALERLQRDRVDVLLSGLDLPGEGPFELLRRLRLEPEWRGLPAVALASGPEEMERREDREFEFDDYQMRFDKEATLNSISRLAAVGREQQLAEQRK